MISTGRFRLAQLLRWSNVSADSFVRRCWLSDSSHVRTTYPSGNTHAKGLQLQQQTLSSSDTALSDDQQNSNRKKESDWKFGIVAAAIAPQTNTGHDDRSDDCHSRGYYDCMIGMNGTQLPWKSCPEDRRLFVATTIDQILIVGRRTALQECHTFQHINHVKYCIVVSSSIPSLTCLWEWWGDSNNIHKKPHSDGEVIQSAAKTDIQKQYRPVIAMRPKLRLASSLQHALDLARDVLEPRLKMNHTDTKSCHHHEDDGEEEEGNHTNNPIKTWIGGGQRLYEESILHPNASLVSLSWMKLPIENQQMTSSMSDMTDACNSSGIDSRAIARFPHPSTWVGSYQLLSSKEYCCCSESTPRPSKTISKDLSISITDGGHASKHHRGDGLGHDHRSLSPPSSRLSVDSFTHCMYYRK